MANENIEGLQTLIDKLDKLDNAMNKVVAKKVLKEVAEEIKDDMKSVSPVSRVRNIHGVDGINVGNFIHREGFSQVKVGMSAAISGHGEEYWELVKGLWFQNFKTDEPNYGWYDKFIDKNKKKYINQLEEDLSKEIRKLLK